MVITAKQDLDAIRKEGLATLYPARPKIRVGAATCGMATGANAVLQAIKEKVAELEAEIEVGTVGCLGLCQREPLVDVLMPGLPRVVYCDVAPKIAEQIVDAAHNGQVFRKNILGKISSEHFLILNEKRVLGNGKGQAKVYDVPELDSLPFYSKQLKIALRNVGYIDPMSIEEYVARGGYYTAFRIFAERPKRTDLIRQMIDSGLRGRGGGGFMTGWKWDSCWKARGGPRFVICNADEGDPGAYMDRSLLEGDPHAVIEGMLIGAYAISSFQGYIYVRNEYPEAVKRVAKAIEQAREYGILGEKAFGTNHRFDIDVSRGAGAFVCGESTALMASLEGKVGEPRAKYVHTTEAGLWNNPSTLNNVETWANVPAIYSRGAEWFKSIGIPQSTGTKVFSVVGQIKNTGLIEVPMGVTLKEILYDICGGPLRSKPIKAVQTGGPSGGCLIAMLKGYEGEDITAEYAGGEKPGERATAEAAGGETHAHLSVDFDTLTEHGSMMGSGGMIVMDTDACMVDVARFFIDFLKDESCGKCVPCREGIRNMHEILTRICEGKGTDQDIPRLMDLSRAMVDTSLCALGSSAPNPVLSTLQYFRDEYVAHIKDKKCPAGVCRELITYSIDPAKCTGCHLCYAPCPTKCITGQAKKVHTLKASDCIKCGSCSEVCKFDAVVRA